MGSTTTGEAIALRTNGKVVVADFTKGELKDEREILRLLDKLGDFVERREGVNLLLNMANVTYVSSSGLGVIVSLMKKSLRQKGAMKVCCLQPDVREVFEVMQLTKVVPVLDTEEQAVASF
jgi:anti-sigma B factor antagonist